MLNELERTVCDFLAARRDGMVADLREAVEIPTKSGYNEGLDLYRSLMRQRLLSLGAAVSEIPGDPRPAWIDPADQGGESVPPPTLFADRLCGDRRLPRLLLSGHLDTVHPPDGPLRHFTIDAAGTHATGPGVVDMKGGLVIALHALEALAEAGAAVSWSFILNSDEETGSYHSDAALRVAAKDHDYGLALEPAMANGGLVIERPGSGQFIIEATGRAAHVGRDFASGVSAVNALAARILDVAKIPDASRGIIASIGPLSGGVAANVVPDSARAWGNVRVPTEAIAAEVRTKLHALASTSTLEDSLASGNAHVRIQDSFNRPPKPATPGTMALAEAAKAAAASLGQPLPFGSTGGVCDGNNLQAAGLPTIDTLGVRGGGLHTPQEWIELASLVERSQLLAVLMLRLSTPKPE